MKFERKPTRRAVIVRLCVVFLVAGRCLKPAANPPPPAPAKRPPSSGRENLKYGLELAAYLATVIAAVYGVLAYHRAGPPPTPPCAETYRHVVYAPAERKFPHFEAGHSISRCR